MALWRATMFFKMGSEGWSETYFYANGTALEPAVRADAILLAGARLALLNTQSVLIGIRVSDDLVFRDSDLLGSPDFPAAGTSSFTTSLPARTALICRVQSSLNHRRTLKLSGLPNNLSSAGVWQINGPGWSPSANLFISRLQAAWALKINSLVAPPTLNIFSISLTGLSTTSDTTAWPNSAVKGRFSGVRGVLPNPNGRIFDVLKVDANTISILHWAPRGTATVNYGKIRQVVYGVEAITGFVQLRMGERKTGRPFDSPRGRRSVAR